MVGRGGDAGPNTTKGGWEFQSKLRADGYDIAEFKVTAGNCYEIYGRNSDGQKVEIYFNPVDGSIVKQEME